jgi:hypothetical protein
MKISTLSRMVRQNMLSIMNHIHDNRDVIIASMKERGMVPDDAEDDHILAAVLQAVAADAAEGWARVHLMPPNMSFARAHASMLSADNIIAEQAKANGVDVI